MKQNILSIEELESSLQSNYSIVYEISPFSKKDIIKELQNLCFDIRKVDINTYKFEKYLKKAIEYGLYSDHYQETFGPYFKRKALEHYVSFQVMNFKKNDTFMDIASSGSCVPEIVKKMFGLSEVWAQDVVYPRGVDPNKRTIGSNASSMPVAENTFDKMTLHCSFEHFEGQSDIGFILELSRVLKKGGKVCILPLYMNINYHILSNLELMLKRGIPNFDENDLIYLQPRPHNHFGRFYNPQMLKSRIIDNAVKAGLDVQVLDFSFSNQKYSIGTNLGLSILR